MATPSETVNYVKNALEDSGSVPASASYLTQEADFDGGQSKVKIPVIQITPTSSARITDFNTDKVGYVTDGSGNQTGRVFEAEYEMDVQIDVLTVDGRTDTSENIENLTDAVRSALYQHDDAGPAKPLPDDNGNPVDSVWKVRLGEGTRDDDTATTPTLRQWSQDMTVWVTEEFNTTEDYITSVTLPDEDTIIQ